MDQRLPGLGNTLHKAVLLLVEWLTHLSVCLSIRQTDQQADQEGKGVRMEPAGLGKARHRASKTQGGRGAGLERGKRSMGVSADGVQAEA